MYVKKEQRGKGLAVDILNDLESWAKELNYTFCILETGINQPEAIQLYKKTGYKSIENYGQYAGVATSYCFQKTL
jgi:GNAT superfamily N-acetyltransferase